MKETMDQELAEALAMLEKANSALARIFGIEEEGESVQERADRTNPYRLKKEGEGE
jgi:hypothetical protein